MLGEFSVDMHVHTCLSPCAADEMVPSMIIAAARERGLDGLAICDHNSAENVEAVRRAGQKAGIVVLGGMEITSSEEVHVLGIFDNEEGLAAIQETIYDNLPGKNDAIAFGPQDVVNEDDESVGTNDRLLIGATTLECGRVVELIHSNGGIAVASHIDREAFSVLGQLGFISPDAGFDALEISARVSPDDAGRYRSHQLPLVQSSDAHYPADVGKVFTVFTLDSLSVRELGMAFRGEEGRAARL
jgi:predicted metal-dependent phosphoesterase TrpH